MPLPDINLDNPFFSLNLTVVLGIIAFAVPLMVTLLKLFGQKQNANEIPGNNPHCKQQKEDLKKVENTTKENDARMDKEIKNFSEKVDSLREITHEMSREIAVLKNQSNNMEKDIDEIKQDNKEIANRLDNLLKQLLEWMNA